MFLLDQAIDTVYTNLKDLEGLRCVALVGKGFGMIVGLPRFCCCLHEQESKVLVLAQSLGKRARAESETSADTGFDGKLTIHPVHWFDISEHFSHATHRSRVPSFSAQDQIDVVNAAFSPSSQEVRAGCRGSRTSRGRKPCIVDCSARRPSYSTPTISV